VNIKEISTPDRELLVWKARARVAEKSVEKMMKDRGTQEQIAKEIKQAIEAVDPLPRLTVPAKKATTEPIHAVVKASDWQIGEVINPKETEGFGRFNYRLAEKRVLKLDNKLINWTGMHRAGGYHIDEIHIFSEADLVSGNIHYELEVTNEFPAPVAAVKAGMLMAAFAERLLPHFKKVHIHEVNHDNHGRFTRKNQMKQGGKNNWSYVAHQITNTYLKKYVEAERFVIHESDGPKQIANVTGKNFLLCHGHHIMGQMGIPYYGMERDRAREATKRMWMPNDKKFHYISIGHWHVPAIVAGNILVNGNLPGTTEFDHMQGRHAAPTQVSFMVHPEHGLFNWTAWKL
jgi:hypothetical protein